VGHRTGRSPQLVDPGPTARERPTKIGVDDFRPWLIEVAQRASIAIDGNRSVKDVRFPRLRPQDAGEVKAFGRSYVKTQQAPTPPHG